MLTEKNTHHIVKFLIFLFPVLTATVKSAGGVIFFILVLAGCVKGWSFWKKIEPWERKVLVGFVVFCVLVSLSLVNTQHMDIGISKLERYIYFVSFIPAYLLIRQIGVETGRSLLLGAVVGLFIMLIQAVYQTAILEQEYAIGAYHKIIFGDTSMMLAVIVGLGFGAIRRVPWQCVLGIVTVVVGVSTSILSGSRGAWIFLPVSILATFFLYRHGVGRKHWVFAIGAIVLLFTSFYILFQDRIGKGIQNAVEDVELYLEQPRKQNTSLGVRFNLWRDSIAIWKDSPILGTGLGDFSKDVYKRMIRDGADSAFSRTPHGHAHSIYFDALATTGLVGLGGLLFFMLLRPLRYYVFWWGRAENPLQRFYLSGGILVVLGFSVFGLTEGWLSRSSMVIQYLMYTLVFMSSFAINKSKEKDLHSQLRQDVGV